jgi:K+-sensing histidine kinase KdpD
MAKLIFDEAYVLDFQLKNIFAAAKIEAGNFSPHYSRTEIIGMVLRVVGSMNHIADQLKVDVKIENSLPSNELTHHFAYTDAEKLELTLINLCNNAIRFAKPGTVVTVYVSKPDDNHILFTIQNFGKVLTPVEMSEMFDRFKRLEENINSINPGQGLGLSVAKAYSQIIDGEISVESTGEKGNIFSLYLKTQMPTGNENTTEPDGYELFTDDEELF